MMSLELFNNCRFGIELFIKFYMPLKKVTKRKQNATEIIEKY